MTATGFARKIGRGARLAAARYEAHPFAITFRFLGLALLPTLAWLLVVVGVAELFGGGPLPVDPVQASNEGVGLGLLAGTVATPAAGVVLYLLARKGRSK